LSPHKAQNKHKKKKANKSNKRNKNSKHRSTSSSSLSSNSNETKNKKKKRKKETSSFIFSRNHLIVTPPLPAQLPIPVPSPVSSPNSTPASVSLPIPLPTQIKKEEPENEESIPIQIPTTTTSSATLETAMIQTIQNDVDEDSLERAEQEKCKQIKTEINSLIKDLLEKIENSCLNSQSQKKPKEEEEVVTTATALTAISSSSIDSVIDAVIQLSSLDKEQINEKPEGYSSLHSFLLPQSVPETPSILMEASTSLPVNLNDHECNRFNLIVNNSTSLIQTHAPLSSQLVVSSAEKKKNLKKNKKLKLDIDTSSSLVLPFNDQQTSNSIVFNTSQHSVSNTGKQITLF